MSNNSEDLNETLDLKELRESTVIGYKQLNESDPTFSYGICTKEYMEMLHKYNLSVGVTSEWKVLYESEGENIHDSYEIVDVQKG